MTHPDRLLSPDIDVPDRDHHLVIRRVTRRCVLQETMCDDGHCFCRIFNLQLF